MTVLHRTNCRTPQACGVGRMAEKADGRRTPEGGGGRAGRKRDGGYFITAAMERQTWSMLRLLTAATHIRPLSVP